MTMWLRHKSIMLKVQDIISFEIHYGRQSVYAGMSSGDFKALPLDSKEDTDSLFDGICQMMRHESGCGEYHKWFSVFNQTIITTEELIRFSRENAEQIKE